MEIIKTLVRLGVESDRLVAEGLGDQEPLAPPDTPEGRRSNERVEITIVRGDSR